MFIQCRVTSETCALWLRETINNLHKLWSDLNWQLWTTLKHFLAFPFPLFGSGLTDLWVSLGPVVTPTHRKHPVVTVLVASQYPWTIEELKDNIRAEMAAILFETPANVMENAKKRARLFLTNNGGHLIDIVFGNCTERELAQLAPLAVAVATLH